MDYVAVKEECLTIGCGERRMREAESDNRQTSSEGNSDRHKGLTDNFALWPSNFAQFGSHHYFLMP